jgi:aminoglycoside phosphotransferase (APT) family kinase protein
VAGRDPLSAAVAVARAHGLRVDHPRVLRDRLNVLIHLRPAPVVARVAGSIAKVRPGTEFARHEVDVAGHLARAGAPVVAPSAELDPGPHEHAGHVITFWDHVPDHGPPDPVASGAALRECHAALRAYPGELPLLGRLSEAEALLARLAGELTIDAAAAAELQRRFDALLPVLRALRAPVQPLHGDAHLGNVLNGPDGPRWNDWEDTCLGPVGWDAGCLLVSSDGHGAAAALGAAGIALDPAELALWIEARSLQAAVWRAFIHREHPERRAAHEAARRAAGG